MNKDRFCIVVCPDCGKNWIDLFAAEGSGLAEGVCQNCGHRAKLELKGLRVML